MVGRGFQPRRDLVGRGFQPRRDLVGRDDPIAPKINERKNTTMAREKGMGNLQQEKSGRWTVRFCVNGKRVSRSARTKDRQIAEN